MDCKIGIDVQLRGFTKKNTTRTDLAIITMYTDDERSTSKPSKKEETDDNHDKLDFHENKNDLNIEQIKKIASMEYNDKIGVMPLSDGSRYSEKKYIDGGSRENIPHGFKKEKIILNNETEDEKNILSKSESAKSDEVKLKNKYTKENAILITEDNLSEPLIQQLNFVDGPPQHMKINNNKSSNILTSMSKETGKIENKDSNLKTVTLKETLDLKTNTLKSKEASIEGDTFHLFNDDSIKKYSSKTMKEYNQQSKDILFLFHKPLSFFNIT